MRIRTKAIPPQISQSLFQKGVSNEKGYEPEAIPSDLTDQQWAILKPLPPAGPVGGTKTDMRSVVNAIFYATAMAVSGEPCPRFPMEDRLQLLRGVERDGTWKAINDASAVESGDEPVAATPVRQHR